jgi:hypothetical protein
MLTIKKLDDVLNVKVYLTKSKNLNVASKSLELIFDVTN